MKKMVYEIRLNELAEKVNKEVKIKKKKAINAIIAYAGSLDYDLVTNRKITKASKIDKEAVLIESKENRLIPGKVLPKEHYVLGIAKEADLNVEQAGKTLDSIEKIINEALDEKLKVEKKVVIESLGTYLYRDEDGKEYFIPLSGTLIK